MRTGRARLFDFCEKIFVGSCSSKNFASDEERRHASASFPSFPTFGARFGNAFPLLHFASFPSFLELSKSLSFPCSLP